MAEYSETDYIDRIQWDRL